MINDEIMTAMRRWNWTEILHRAGQLEDLNDRQWRFMKGLVSELIVERWSSGDLKYVGEDHRDFIWRGRDLSVELKGGLSGCLYTVKGALKKSYTVKFNNSNGTNTKTALEAAEVADILLIIKRDGAIAVDRDTVIAHGRHGGDGWEVVLPRGCVQEITGPMEMSAVRVGGIRRLIEDAIRAAI